MTYQINWGDLTPEIFLKEYWQKKPLFIRGAISNDEGYFVVPIDADELAGLAMEEEVQSRIVGQKQDYKKNTWFVEHGPFDDFSKFGEKYWTLLVQATNNWSEDTSKLLEPFRFMPNWRLDDVMVSFSTPHGGVGAHLDQYDVFIIQGQGKRRWQIGLPDQSLETLIPHEDLKQVSSFSPVIDEETQAGDLLYIPPNHPHHGVAIENSVNYSIGFQAPSSQELWSGFADKLLDECQGESRFADPDRKTTESPEIITQQEIVQLKQFMLQDIEDSGFFDDFICKHLTRSYHQMDVIPIEEPYSFTELTDLFKEADGMQPVLGLKALISEETQILYINGEKFGEPIADKAFKQRIAKGDPIMSKEVSSGDLCENKQTLILALINQGYWYIC